ncbi:MAG: 5'-nucleotidase C-terminal domain-containing protein [Candidatus Tectomicrobia bacterium]|nr:5'-nucleotidase C-terminal domain-containing protein [Candidatus Tectomicrobia bacterium]
MNTIAWSRLKRFFFAVLTLALAAVWCGSAFAAPVAVTFLHTNDIYLIDQQDGHGGFPKLMTLLKQERAANPNTITTFGGDLFSPSVMSGFTKGSQMVELMDAIGLDYAVPGNHEFDFGPEIFEQNIKASKAVWLAANLRRADGKPVPGLVENAIVEIEGMKIGMFGVLTPETVTLSSGGDAFNFTDPVATARSQVEKLRSQGADFIVAFSHLDWAEDRELARQVRGIGLMLTGHDHMAATTFVGDTLLVQAGSDAHWLAAVDVKLDYVTQRGKKELITRYQWRMHSTAGIEDDRDIAALVQTYNAQLDAELNIIVGKTSTGLDTRRETVRTQEAAFANLIADAMRESVGADVALTNGGGIRGDTLYEAGTEITRKTVLTELPFGNMTVKLEISGQVLLAALESGVSKVENVRGQFPHVSGMTYAFDPTLPPGSRIIAVQVGNQPLDPTATYTLATNDYIAAGGDNYGMFKNLKRLVDASGATLTATAVMNYIEKRGAIAPKLEGRITARVR